MWIGVDAELQDSLSCKKTTCNRKKHKNMKVYNLLIAKMVELML